MLPLLARHLPQKEYLVVSPDKGGVSRARKIATLLKAPLAVMKKKRTHKTLTIQFSDDVAGKDILLVDDMISTGLTLCKAALVLKRNGAENIYAIATHGLFVGKALQNLKKSAIREIIVSNTFLVKPSSQIKVVRIESLLCK